MSIRNEDRRHSRREAERHHAREPMPSGHSRDVAQGQRHHQEADVPLEDEQEPEREETLGCLIAEVDDKIPQTDDDLQHPAAYPVDISLESDEENDDSDHHLSVSHETIVPGLRPGSPESRIPRWGVPGLSGYERSTPDVLPPPSAVTDYTTCVPIHSDVWTVYECAYIFRRTPMLSPDTSRTKGTTHQLQPQSYKLKGVISQMKTQLENAKVDSVHQDQRRAFVPCVKLYAIMNEQAVRQALKTVTRSDKELSDEEIAAYAYAIAPSEKDLSKSDGDVPQFRRVFAVLILIGKEEFILDFIRHKVNDVELCDGKVTFELPATEDEEKLQSAYDEFPAPCRDMKSWSKQDIRNFQATRWEVSPPFFFQKPREGQPGYRDPALIHYELRSSNEILPFLKVERKPVTKGGFSQIEFYQLHEDQHDLKRYTIHKKRNPIAVKRLEDTRDPEHPRPLTERFTNERYILQRLTLGSKSEHLVKLLATYETLGDNCPNKYHFIFEASDGTIENLWTDGTLWKEKKSTTASLSRWAARQCLGLASALAQFHKFQRWEGDDNPKTRGMHSDLKPDNILWYKDWDVSNDHEDPKVDELGILQIADFGLSSFHSTGTVFDVQIFTGNDYRAPETERWFFHPPASDVWSLGCLFLDFATWLVGGPEAYEAFVAHRKTPGGFVEQRARFSEFEQEKKKNLIEVVVSSKVVEHAAKLHRSKKASQFVRDLIFIVLHKMLVVEDLDDVKRRPDQPRPNGWGRIASHEVTDILEHMRERGTSDQTYYAPSKQKTEFTKPRRSAISFTGTRDELKKDIYAQYRQAKAKS